MSEDIRKRGTAATGWISAAFWCLILGWLYAAVGIPPWWAWVLFVGLGAALTAAWWRSRYRSRYRLVFGALCGLGGAAAVAVAAAALVVPTTVAVGSVGDARIECGSVLVPFSGASMRVTSAATGEPVVLRNPIPRDAMEQRCADDHRLMTRNAASVAVVALLLIVRSAGHLRPAPSREHDSAPPQP
ncbi:hypothetical protein [Prescottella subtropica]|uniref:hypothetical protein n=1 Tax=Prescottella subtropica TaxID=2545757 RepID=UPI0010FA5B98|nr:hypothetical protein [Prescottella subtropica]